MEQIELVCKLCGRDIPARKYAEKHHLQPVSRGGKHKEKVLFCVDCGDQVHQLFTNKELEQIYGTLEALRSEERVQKWIKWIRKQTRFGVCHKEKKKKR